MATEAPVRLFRTADRRLVRELAAQADGPGKVLSVIIDLHPSRFAEPGARRTQIRSLLDGARENMDDDTISHDDRIALTEDLERAESFLTAGDIPTDGATGVALFVSGPRAMFDVVRLTRPVSAAATVGEGPAVEHLAEYLSDDTWAALLVNSKTGRMFAGQPEILHEIETIEDEVHGRHKQGGWSQARYQRSVEREIENHLRHVVERLVTVDAARRFDHIALASPEPIGAALGRMLPDPVRRRVVGTIDVDVENVNGDDVRAALEPLVAEVEERREAELLGRWREQLGTGGRAVAGFPDVSRALADRRVETVLIAGGSEPRRAVLEEALAQDADITVVRHHDDLEKHGGIAALLRF